MNLNKSEIGNEELVICMRERLIIRGRSKLRVGIIITMFKLTQITNTLWNGHLLPTFQRSYLQEELFKS